MKQLTTLKFLLLFSTLVFGMTPQALVFAQDDRLDFDSPPPGLEGDPNAQFGAQPGFEPGAPPQPFDEQEFEEGNFGGNENGRLPDDRAEENDPGFSPPSGVNTNRRPITQRRPLRPPVQSRNGGSNNDGDNNQPPSEPKGTGPIGGIGSSLPGGRQGSSGQFARLNPETSFGPDLIPNFDFPDADIVDVAKAIQKLTGVNFIFDPDVKGKISILSPSPITVGDAWRAFVAALGMKSYTIVPSGKYFKIVRQRDAKESPVKIYAGKYTPDLDAFITRVIPLRYIGADEIARNFRMFISRDARIATIDQTNTIIITDTGSNIKRLIKIIEMLDVPGHEEVLEVIPVQNAAAKEIADLLEQILSSQGSTRGSSRPVARRTTSRFGSSATGEIRTKDGGVINEIIADERTNSLVVLANVTGLKKIRGLVKKLDRENVVSRGGRIHVYYLQYANAEEVSKTLQSLAQGASSRSSTSPSSRTTIRGAVPTPDAAEFEGGIRITADKANNSLVITASPSDYNTLKAVIAKIDIPRDQVYVEAVIMELSMNNFESFAVNFTAGGLALGSVHSPGFVNFLSGQGDVNSFLSNLNGLFGAWRSSSTLDVDINGTTVKVPTAAALINALATATRSNVLSRPQIMTLDNEDATIKVTDKVPFTTTSSTGGANALITQKPEFQDIGLTLKIKPSISRASDYVKLDIDQSFSTPLETISQSTSSGVRTAERSATTKVVVKDRDTIAIGGLMRDNSSKVKSKVPLLGDIPLLGWLFRSTRETVEKTNLILFLTPRIIKSYGTTREILEDKLGERQEFVEDILGGEDPFKKDVERLILSLPDNPNGESKNRYSETIGE